MPAEIVEVNLFAKITGEDPLWDAGVVGGQKFVPDWAKAARSEGKANVVVTGPLLNAKGEPYKTKRGLVSFDIDGRGNESTPTYVLNLLIAVRDA